MPNKIIMKKHLNHNFSFIQQSAFSREATNKKMKKKKLLSWKNVPDMDRTAGALNNILPCSKREQSRNRHGHVDVSATGWKANHHTAITQTNSLSPKLAVLGYSDTSAFGYLFTIYPAIPDIYAFNVKWIFSYLHTHPCGSSVQSRQ